MKLQNDVARRENEKIPFDPSITSENNVAECFRVGRLSKNPAQRHVTGGPNRRHDKIKIHTDGAPGEHHSNQIGELIATTTAIQAVPHFVPLKIITDSTYVINGLLKQLEHSATTHFKWVKPRK